MKKILGLIKKLREFTQIPLVGMGYINNILTYGVDKFIGDFKAAGLDGMIIPDLPHEESAVMRAVCKKADFHLIEFVTPKYDSS